MARIVKGIIVYSLIVVIILGISHIINCIAPEADIALLPGVQVRARELLNNTIALIIIIPGWIMTLATLIAALARLCMKCP